MSDQLFGRGSVGDRVERLISLSEKGRITKKNSKNFVDEFFFWGLANQEGLLCYTVEVLIKSKMSFT